MGGVGLGRRWGGVVPGTWWLTEEQNMEHTGGGHCRRCYDATRDATTHTNFVATLCLCLCVFPFAVARGVRWCFFISALKKLIFLATSIYIRRVTYTQKRHDTNGRASASDFRRKDEATFH